MEKKMRTKLVKLKTALTGVISNHSLSEVDSGSAIKAFELCDRILIGKFDLINTVSGTALLRANLLEQSRILKKSKNRVLIRVGEELEKMGKK